MKHMPTHSYREVQRFNQTWILALVLFIAGISWYGAYLQLIQKKPFGNNPAPDSVVMIIWIIFGVGFPWFFASLRMMTEVRTDGVYVRFFPLHRTFQRFPFQDILSYTVKTYRPLRDYGGWGIRYGPQGKAYNVRGNRGVLLEMRSGKALLIGSQQPERLAAAIAAAFPPSP